MQVILKWRGGVSRVRCTLVVVVVSLALSRSRSSLSCNANILYYALPNTC